jgi:hypothetical protein
MAAYSTMCNGKVWPRAGSDRSPADREPPCRRRKEANSQPCSAGGGEHEHKVGSQ